MVDDEAAFGGFVRNVATNLNYDVELTIEAHEFMQAYLRQTPDVIVMDIVMPNFDGIELTRWLAEQKCPAKIFIATGYNPHYAKSAEVLGTSQGLTLVEILEKPVSVAKLRSALS